MKESEMKTKECRAPGVANYTGNQDSYIWPKCSASDCAMWEPEYKLESKQTQRSEEIPEGWHLRSKDVDYKQTIGRYIPTDCGDCGLKTKDLERRGQ